MIARSQFLEIKFSYNKLMQLKNTNMNKLRNVLAEPTTKVPCGQDGIFRSYPVQVAIFQAQRYYSATLAVLHQKIKSKIFDEVIGVERQRLHTKQGSAFRL